VERLEDRTLLSAPTLTYKDTTLPGVPNAVVADSAGNAYITGAGNSYVGKLNPTGTAWVWLDYLGGDHGTSIALDSSGNVYVAGDPTGGTIAFATTSNAFSTTPSSAFVAKLDPNGNLLYSSYIPGGNLSYNNNLEAYEGGIAVDASGNMYVTGGTSGGLVTTSGAYQSTFVAGPYNSDTFFAEFNPSLSGSASLLYSTYLGNGGDAGYGIAVDGTSNAYISGFTAGESFPVTAGAFQTTSGGLSDAFVAKFNPTLSGSGSLVYSTYLGGNKQDGISSNTPIVIDPNWSVMGIAVDSAGEAFVTGRTMSSNFPVTSGAFRTTYQGSTLNGRAPADGFVTKLNAAGSGLVYSTFIGGTNNSTMCDGIAIDANGNATITGWTNSTKFPTKNPIQSSNAGGMDAFVTTLNAAGSGLLFSTYLGTSSNDVGVGAALDPSGNIYMVGFQGANGVAYKIGSAYSAIRTAANIASPVATASVGMPILPPSAASSSIPASVSTGSSGTPVGRGHYIPAPNLSTATVSATTPIFAAHTPKSRQTLLDELFAGGWNQA
jgi:hypothetical protein